MAFRQQHWPQSSRIANHAQQPATEVATSSQQKRPLDQSEEWVLFSPTAPSATERTHTTSTERTPRTAGLSRFSEFGSLDTAARSDQDDDNGTLAGTEEELDSLDDGLHAFHEPSEYGAPAGRLLQSGETVLPTHDGMGEFQPEATTQEHMWQFERPRRRATRRRSSVQRHFNMLDENENQEQDRRQRIEKWRMEQSQALLEEIEKETRRRRRISITASARARADSTQDTKTTPAQATPPVADAQSETSEEGTENLSFWQRITRRVIRDLIGLDQDTLSVIFGESLPEGAITPKPGSPIEFSADKVLEEAGIDASALTEDGWQTRLLERVAQELGILVHQLSEHPGAFSTYQRAVSTPEYVGSTSTQPTLPAKPDLASSRPTSATSPHFAPTFPPNTYSEASLWGIEEESPDADTRHTPPAPTTTIAQDLALDQEYWERSLDVKMIFNFLVKRFTSRLPTQSQPQTHSLTSNVTASTTDSARRAAIIRQNHPLVNSSTATSSEARRYRASVSLKPGILRSSSSCASQSTKKSRPSGASARNYWDLGGSVGSGSVLDV
jgi:hypothetical protein